MDFTVPFNSFHRHYLSWVSILHIESAAPELAYEKIVPEITERDGSVSIGNAAVERQGKLEVQADHILDGGTVRRFRFLSLPCFASL